MPEPCPGIASIRASTGGSSNSYIAFSAKDYGADVDEIAPTLRGMGHDESHANGGGQVAVRDQTSWSLMALTSVANLQGTRDPAGNPQQPQAAERISSTTAVMQQMAVRRLTPRECERLQGFPDDYTLVECRRKLAADGPRYRALGNSMAVPVMSWIGQRIATVHAIVSREVLVSRRLHKVGAMPKVRASRRVLHG